jgi:hypothetical protein
MQNKPTDFDVCFEALRAAALPAYENDASGIEYRVGRIISEFAGHTPASDGLPEFSMLKGRSSGC